MHICRPILFTGSDTTAVVLSNLFFFLMSNRQAFALLQAEVDKFYPPDEDGLSTKFLGDMPYLSACMSVIDFTHPLSLL
jgi:cytochrome P450